MNNTIGRKTIVAKQDTTINDLYFLAAGGQFTEPVNLDGQFMCGSNIVYSLPAKKLKSKLNINARVHYSHTPTLINNKKTYSDSYNVSQRFALSSNISEKVDFTLSSNINYRKTINSSNAGAEYLSQTNSLNLYWNFYKNFVFRTNAKNDYQNNYITKNKDFFWHLNIGLSTKLFKTQRGELSFTAYDLLSKEDERSHATTDLYSVDYYTNKLSKFYILTFSYKLRNSNGKSPNRLHRRGHGMYRNLYPMM